MGGCLSFTSKTVHSIAESIGRAGFDPETFFDPHLSDAAPLLEELRTKVKKLNAAPMMFQRALRDMAKAEKRFDKILHEAMNTTTTTVTLEAPASSTADPLVLGGSVPSSAATSPHATPTASPSAAAPPQNHQAAPPRDWLKSLTHRTAAGGVRRRSSVSTGTAPVVGANVNGSDIVAATADTTTKGAVPRRVSKQEAAKPTPNHPQLPAMTEPEPCSHLSAQMDRVDVVMFRLSQHQNALAMHYTDAQTECRALTKEVHNLYANLEAEYGRVRRTLYKDYANLKYEWIKVGEKLETLGEEDADASVAIQRGELVRSLEQYQVEAEAASRRLRSEYDRMLAEFTPQVEHALVEVSKMQCRLCIDIGASWRQVYPADFVDVMDKSEMEDDYEEEVVPASRKNTVTLALEEEERPQSGNDGADNSIHPAVSKLVSAAIANVSSKHLLAETEGDEDFVHVEAKNVPTSPASTLAAPGDVQPPSLLSHGNVADDDDSDNELPLSSRVQTFL